MLTIRTLGKFQIRNEEHIVNEEEIRSPKMINLLCVSDSSQKSDTDVL